jgi:hypothetical protein
MRIGLIGPTGKAKTKLEKALDLLTGDLATRQVIYLGADDAAAQVVAERARAGLDPDEFLRRSVEVACSGSADQIAELLSEQRAAPRLDVVRELPAPPARAIEMLDTWIVLAVHDKAVLDEDDIANAHVIVYGRADEPVFKRFGPRCFFSPGPLALDQVGLLELMPEGHVEIRLLGLDGEVRMREALYVGGAKLVVTS